MVLHNVIYNNLWFFDGRPCSTFSPLIKKWINLIFLKTFYLRAIIFHMLIGLDRDMPPIDIQLIRSKVKVRRITFVQKKISPSYH